MITFFIRCHGKSESTSNPQMQSATHEPSHVLPEARALLNNRK